MQVQEWVAMQRPLTEAKKSVSGKLLYGIIDRNGNMVIDFAYTEIQYQHHLGDRALVCKKGLW